VAGNIGEDEIAQSCALAYTSDELPTEAASRSHPLRARLTDEASSYGEVFVGASLDHTIYFHRPGRHDDWVLHDFSGHGVVGARGLAIGHIYARDGLHLATVIQETLIRERTR
jgi:acyl-CoA thioesterase-2